MKIKLIAFLISAFYISLYSQEKYQLFQSFEFEANTLRNIDKVKNAVYAEISAEKLASINRIKPKTWNLAIPLSEDGLVLDFSMSKFDFIDKNLEVIGTESGKTKYNVGNYYIISGQNSRCSGTFSIYDENVMGIIGFENGDNYNIGEIRNSPGQYIFYRDQDLDRNPRFICDTRDQDHEYEDYNDSEAIHISSGAKCIDIYLEADYALYNDFGKNMTKTVNYILGLFAETALLYKNEGISIKVSRIKVWQTPDDYDTTSSHKALNQFGENNPDSETDLNLLLALGAEGLGGVAYINALCNESIHFAYANIDSIYNNIPNYSWSVMVITHELGHNLGSNHTHSCRWTADLKQIDDCGNVYFHNQGKTPEGEDCFDPENPIIPIDGGSIMSYCHLIGATGINLTKGFGEHPGNVIRKRVSQAQCVDICDSFGDTTPKAKFTSNTLTCVEGEVKFNDYSVNFPNEWTWVFEKKDGYDTSYHKSPVIKYYNEGQFDVTLIAMNAAGSDTLTKTDLIKVIPGPIAGFTYEYLDLQTVQFSNTSTNSDKYFWRFGDGNISYFKNPKRKFNKGGKFFVELRATKDTCNTHNYSSDTVEIKIPYKASILYNKNNICPGDSIYFQTPDISYDSVKWTFTGGDIESSMKENLYVKYTESGKFDVSLITFSPYGTDTLIKNDLVTVFDEPHIYFDQSINNDTVYFQNQSEDANSYLWNFGDSTNTTEINPIHIYNENGKYIITLIGKNSCFSSEFSKEIIIDIVSVHDDEKEKSLTIHPNPSSGEIKISFLNQNIYLYWVKIRDLKGNEVFKREISDYHKSDVLQYDLNHLKNGIYQLEINSNKGISNSKLVIVK